MVCEGGGLILRRFHAVQVFAGVPRDGAPTIESRPFARELAGELEVSEATIHRWRAQDKIDSGVSDGVSTTERVELAAAQTRIRGLEAELAATKLASELFAKGRVVRPKEIHPIVAELGEVGHGLKASCRLLSKLVAGYEGRIELMADTWRDWMLLLTNLLQGNRAEEAYDVVCPSCEGKGVEVRFVAGADRLGWGAVWCPRCMNGLHLSRMVYPDGVTTLDIEEEVDVASFEPVQPT